MTEPWNWEEKDIQELINNGVQESLTLDYKRCAALDKRNPKSKTDISKDVSSFANSAGGVLVYGVVEDNHLPRRIDEGLDPTEITREWLEQVINSDIQRHIEGVRIKQVGLKTSNPGKVLYVVYVPQSDRAPHMAEDHVFYKRYNFQSVPMEEYEVRDTALRHEAPDLQISLQMANPEIVDLPQVERKLPRIPVSVVGTLSNNSPVPAMYIIIKIYIDPQIGVLSPAGLSPAGEATISTDDRQMTVNVLTANWAPPRNMPVWGNILFPLTDGPIELTIPVDDKAHIVQWEIHSPSMLPRRGNYLLWASSLGPSRARVRMVEK